MTRINFGKRVRTTELDDNGSTKTIIQNVRNREVVGKTKEYFEIRHKVENDLEEMAQFSAFFREYTADPTMLDPAFRVEGRNNPENKRFAIRCFTRVVS